MRVEIPVIGPAYKNRELPLSAQVTKNLWPEINPEARNIVCLHHTPGCKPWATLEGADRGMHLFNDEVYTVNGSALYKIDFDGTDTNLGYIEGSGRCQFADDGTKLIIVTGGTPYLYTADNGLERITDPDLVNPTTVAYLNQQFLFDQNTGTPGQFVTSEVAVDFNVDGLDIATAESSPDDLIRLITFRQHVFMFGQRTVEPWYNTGVGRPPFARVQGGIRPYGIAGVAAAAPTPEWIYFLDHNRIPRRTAGSADTYTNIGNPALGVEFARYGTISDCIVFSYVRDHQTFVVYTFPTEDRTWVFHEPSGSWFQWSYGVDNSRALGNSAVDAYGTTYVADHTNGNIYELDPCTYTDNGEPIQRRRATATIHGGLFKQPGKKLFFDRVEFVVAYGDCQVRSTGPVAPGGIVQGICGTVADITPYDQLLAASSIWPMDTEEYIEAQYPSAISEVWDDTKQISFTAAFSLDTSQTPAANEGAYFLAVRTDGDDYRLRIYIDEDGHFRVRGANSSGTEILNMTLTNSGGSFCDSALRMIALTIDLSDTSRREVYLDGSDVTADCTWTTYTDDYLNIDITTSGWTVDLGFYWDSVGLAVIPFVGGGAYPTPVTSGGFGLLSFDDSCSLICPAVWDSNGWIRDFGDYEGWYTEQPRLLFPSRLWKIANLGSSEVGKENTNTDSDVGTWDSNSATNNVGGDPYAFNYGVGTDNTADGYASASSPSPPDEEDTVALEQDHWTNLNGSVNFVNYNDFTQVSWEAFFGVALDSSDGKTGNFTANRAIAVSTSDPDNKLTIVNSAQCESAAIVLCNADGTILDYCYQDGTTTINGGAVTIPADRAQYYVIITSNTGNIRVKWWDASVTVNEGDYTFSEFFDTYGYVSGATFLDGNQGSLLANSFPVPSSGVSIQFTVPAGSDGKYGTFSLQGPGVYNNHYITVTDTAGSSTGDPGLVQNTQQGWWYVGTSKPAGCGSPAVELTSGETKYLNLFLAGVFADTSIISGQAISFTLGYKN